MAILRYTLLRLAMFAGAFALLWLLGLRGFLLAAVAVVVGALLSYLLLPSQGQAAAAALAERHARHKSSGRTIDDAIARDEAEEDALLDGEDGRAEDRRPDDR